MGVDADAEILAGAAVDPTFMPDNPNAELETSAPLNPVTDPLFTPAAANTLTAQGLNLSAFGPFGLAGSPATAVPETPSILSFGAGMLALLAIAHARRLGLSRAAIPGFRAAL
jgi:hypothetical protein